MKLIAIIGFYLIISIPSHAEELMVGVGLELPPYVFSETDDGIELEIVIEALAVKGHTVSPVYLPFARVPFEMKSKTIDAALTINESSGITDIFYSDVHVVYQNVTVTLTDRNISIDSIQDLTGKSIYAFQNAGLYLGGEYEEVTKVNTRYLETNAQNVQIKMLFSQRAEAIVLDIYIFNYFRNQEAKLDTSEPVTVHEIFPPSPYKVAFQNRKYRDDFNQGLKELKESGRYQEIIDKYIK